MNRVAPPPLNFVHRANFSHTFEGKFNLKYKKAYFRSVKIQNLSKVQVASRRPRTPSYVTNIHTRIVFT